MALNALPNNADSAALIRTERERLRRYLPDELYEALDDPQPGGPLLRPYIHIAAARYTIATYLPRLLVRQLLQERRASPWLEWVEGSLLFADLSGSTALAEQLGAVGREGIELMTEFLNHIFETMIQVIQTHGGDLVAFGGDALLVFFSDTRHARTATLAALALQEALHGYVKTVPGIGSFPMHLHIGVESGRIAFVSAGAAESLHYSVLGETVNGVAAAEALAGPGEVVVGPRTRADLGDDAQGWPIGTGFLRVQGLGGERTLPAPEPELEPHTGDPEQALPALLDDLDRLSAHIPYVLLGRILADPQRPEIEAELRPVTVVFSQVVGLEDLASTLEPAVAAQAVQLYVSAAQEVIEQYGGVVNKLDVADEGIKLVAIFGAPTAYEDHVERAARAALGMRERLVTVNRAIAALVRKDAGHRTKRLSAAPDGLRQRIGLNLGTAFAGNVGSPSRKEYTVMGDAVNVAARVMSTAAWDEVWCSEGVARVVEARVECADRGSVALKGKAAPLRLFQMRAERESSVVLVSDAGPLVGRTDELAWLLDQLEGTLAGSGRAVRVTGDAGVGKSRLAAALLDAARDHGVRIIPAACFSYTASIPYAAWGEWLKSLCGIVSGDADAIRARKLADRLRAVDPSLEEWLPLLGDLVRLDIPESRLTRGLDPQLRQARRFDLLMRLLRGAAAEGPVLTLFEDLHWADPISLDLWRRAVRSIGDLPVLLLGLHRATTAFAGGDGASVLELHELSAAESGVLAEQLADEHDLPRALVGQLATRAAGNPLFLAELMRAVAAHQVDEADAPAEALAVEDLPDSLNGLLLSRIDRLDEISRSVLRVASVIGQRIPFGVLQSIQPNDQKTLLRQLARLDSEDLTLLERVEPERVHAFRHALIQEVAYQSMLYARRRELHGRIGEYLEQRYSKDLDDYYGLLAHHYRLSDRRDKAVRYLMLAGEAARANYANEEAAQYFRWALEAIADESDPRAWEAHDALADVCEVTGRYEDALAQHAIIISAPGVTADIARRAHRKRGSVHEKQGQYQAALEELDRAMAIATSGVPGISPLALPRTFADIAMVRQRLGEYDLAITACEEGLARLRHENRNRWDELIEADLHSILGGIYGMRGDYPRSQHHFERCLQAREAADDLAGVSAAHSNLGYLWQLQSEYERAIDHYERADAIARKLELPYVLMTVLVNSADALIKLGSLAEAEQRSLAALDLARKINAQHMAAQIQNTLGMVYHYEGRIEDALAAYDEAQRMHKALGSAYEEGDVLVNIALAYSATGASQEALTAAQQALDRAEALQSQRLRAEALIARAEAALGMGDRATADSAAATALQLAQQIGSKYDEGIAQRLLGQAAALAGRPFVEHFEQSMALLNTIKHRIGLARTWAEYGQALVVHGNHQAGEAYLQQAREAFDSIGARGELDRLGPQH